MHKAVGRIECYRLSWLKCQSLLGNGFLDFFGSCLGCFSIRGNLSSDALASSLNLLAQLVVSNARGAARRQQRSQPERREQRPW